MKARVVDLVGNRAKPMWVSTFHSAAVRILRTDIDRLGISRNFSIYDDTDAKRLITLVTRDQNLDPKKFQPRAIMNWISHQKTSSLPRIKQSRLPKAEMIELMVTSTSSTNADYELPMC